VAGREGSIHFDESGVANQSGAKIAAEFGKQRRRGEDQIAVGGFIVGGAGGDGGAAVQKAHYSGHAKNVLIEAAEE